MGFVKFIDRISAWTGGLAAWLIIPLLLGVVYEVIMRHVFNAPTKWGYDTAWMLFAAQFLIGGAYTLLRKGHIRIDIVYNLLSKRGKMIHDLVCYLVFFLMPAVVFTWAGVRFAAEAWEQIAYICELVDRYDLIYVEDPLHEEDFSGFADLTAQVGERCLVCGDDLFVTSSSRIVEGIEQGSANCVLIKPNQVGTLSDTFDAIHLAHSSGMDTVMSHRSGETTDMTIAHLATAFRCIFLKTGVVGGERTAK